MDDKRLTIREAATLLNCHPNTIRNRIKEGRYKAEQVVGDHGPTYLLRRSELEGDAPTNSITVGSQADSLPNVKEVMQDILEPFVKELGDVREELGRERERREQVEHERDLLQERIQELEAAASTGYLSADQNDKRGAESEEGKSLSGRTLGILRGVVGRMKSRG